MPLPPPGDSIRIDRSTFNQVQGDLNHYQIAGDLHTHDGEHGLLALSRAASVDALHDASERFPPPKCHPETRKEVRSILVSWIEDPNPVAYVIWMYGPAGAGKSSIAQTIAEWCRAFNNHLAGTFFFLRGRAGRQEGSRLFCTLAYQLALYVPGLREHVNRAMSIDSTLPQKDLDTQFRTLVIEPFQKLSSPPTDLPFLIIDGLDECQEFETQKRILTVIGEALQKYNLPLRFLIASRPEAHIREIFDTSLLNQRTRRIVLDGSFHPDRDIRVFLEDGFAGIAKRHQDLMSNVETPWPSPSVIDFLVQKSSGQFIYAATVLKFVDAELHIPTIQLEIVLQTPPVRSTLFSNLDQLYTQVLKVCPYPGILIRIFSLMLVLHCPQPIAVYEDILDLPPGHVSYILRGMHSLVRFPGDVDDAHERSTLKESAQYDHTCGLRLHHASFRDFLLDRSRSEQFFVDSALAHSDFVRSASCLFLGCIDSSWSKQRRGRVPIRDTWGYLKHHFASHLYRCPESQRLEALSGFQRFHGEFKLSVKDVDDDTYLAFESLQALVTALVNTGLYGGVDREKDPSEFDTLHAEHSHWAIDVSIDRLSFSQDTHGLCGKYSRLLDQFYHLALSRSTGFTRLLAYLPGFLTWTSSIPVEWLEDIYGVSDAVLWPYLEENAALIRRWQSYSCVGKSETRQAFDVLYPNTHLSNFLFRQRDAGFHYQDPATQDVDACCHLIAMVFHSDWVQKPRKSESLQCIDRMFKHHLNAANLDRQSMMGFLESSGEITYDIPALLHAPVLNVNLVWSATRMILYWVQRQREKITLGEDESTMRLSLDRRLLSINCRILQQILRLDTFYDSNGASSHRVTLCEPFLVPANLWSNSESWLSDLPQRDPETVGFDSDEPDLVGISNTLLSLHSVRTSLAEFLTHPDWAGDLYIPPDTYHTQFAEIYLYHCDPAVSNITDDWKTLAAHKEWKFHLLRAQATPRILASLLDIRPGPWLAEGLPTGDTQAKIRSMKDILGWLEKLSPTPTAIVERWQTEIQVIGKMERRRPMKSQLRIGASLTVTEDA